MTDFDVVAEGGGLVVFGYDENGQPSKTQKSEHIMVMASGLVLYRLDCDHVATAFGNEVLIQDPTWSILEVNAVRDQPAPTCVRCGDDQAVRAAMNPPVCPKCGRGAA